MGFVRKATIVGSLGTAKAAGLRGNSKKERNAEANEKLAKVEGKRFKAEQKAAMQQLKDIKADQKAARVTSAAVSASVKRSHANTVANREAAASLQAETAPPVVTQGPPPGWYLDPEGESVQRWWDGINWSGVTQPIPISADGTTSLPVEERPEVVQALNPSSQRETAQQLPDGTSPASEPAPSLHPETVGALPTKVPGRDPEVLDAADHNESAGEDSVASVASANDPRAIEFGQVALDAEKIRFVTRTLGQDRLHHVKLVKMGRKPVKIKAGKSGMMDMTLAPSALTMKGLSVEQCASILVEISHVLPDLSAEVPSSEVAEAIAAAGAPTETRVVA